MVKGFSKAIVVGNLTRDPETRTTQNGRSVTAFSVAVNRTYRNNEGNSVEEVSYIDCSAWGPVGETIAKYLHRGSAILVSGRLTQRYWDDEKTGTKRSRVEIMIEDFNFIGGREDSGSFSGVSEDSSYNNKSSKKPTKTTKASEDVLPDEVEVNNDAEIDLEGVPF